MISQGAEYALRAMLLMATRIGLPMTTSQLAVQAQIPGGYLSKILQTLVRAGLVISQRGVNGGFVLGHPPESLTLMDVVTAIDPSHRIRACPLNIPEHVKLCPLHRRIDAAVAAAERELRASTLADLVAQQEQTTPCRRDDASPATANLASRGPTYD